MSFFQENLRKVCLENLGLCFDQSTVTHLDRLMADLPVMIEPKRQRKTKHGDYKLSECGNYHILSFNYPLTDEAKPRALLTVLHELAHASAYAESGRKILPHGPEWQQAFGQFIRLSVEAGLFPAPLTTALLNHAKAPAAKAGVDASLEAAFRRIEHGESAVTVGELPEGLWFTLDGENFFLRGKRLRTRVECQSAEGHGYRISANAVVRQHGSRETFPHLEKPRKILQVRDLDEGCRFAIQSAPERIFTRGPLRRKRFLCYDEEGKAFTIHGNAPVAWRD